MVWWCLIKQGYFFIASYLFKYRDNFTVNLSYVSYMIFYFIPLTN